MGWSASCFLRRVDGHSKQSGWSGEEEYLGSVKPVAHRLASYFSDGITSIPIQE